MTVSTITPADLGLPTKFSSWRPGQWPAIEGGAMSEKQFVVHAAPTGTGKSVIAVAHAILTGGRAVYVTSTKGLQDQCSTDFTPCGMVDLRGRQNYTHCTRGGTCADGRLFGCKGDEDSYCEYIATREEFLKSKLTVTNYSCLLSNILHGEGMGDIDLLILDEAHEAIEELATALEIRINHASNTHIYSSLGIAPPYQSPLPKWKYWATQAIPKLRAQVQTHKTEG